MPTTTWRPTCFDQLIGQEKAKRVLMVDVIAAKAKNTAMPHRVLTGPPGLGKTTIAAAMAGMRGAQFVSLLGREANDLLVLSNALCRFDMSGYNLDKWSSDWGKIVDRKATRPGVLLIDEADGATRSTLQLLHEVLEPGPEGVRVLEGVDEDKRPAQVLVPEITVLFATNFIGDIAATNPAVLSRCAPPVEFRLYSLDELSRIVQQHARVQKVAISEGAARTIADAAQGTPRHAVQMLRSAHDQLIAHNCLRKGSRKKSIDEAVVEQMLEREGIDRHGLDDHQRQYLRALVEAGEPKLGVETLGSLIGVDKKSIERHVEPYLLARRFALRTAGGRRITDAGRRALGLPETRPIKARSRPATHTR